MRVIKAVVVLAVCLAVAACGHTHIAQIEPGPNPPPPPGFRAACGSTPLPFNGFISTCAPAAAYVSDEAVVEVRG